MKTLHFSITINAPKKKVWHTMLDDVTYRQWTEAFGKGSHYEGDWDEGSDMLFLAPEEDGTSTGMVSRIAENRRYEFLSIEHVGEMHHGKPDTTSDKVKSWSGAHENYTFKELEPNVIEVQVDVDTIEDYAEMFEDMWPKALQRLKKIAEKES